MQDGSKIPIEERNGQEVRAFRSEQTALEDIQVFNPAFDVTPSDLIAGIITEYGVITAPYMEILNACKSRARRKINTWKVSLKTLNLHP